MSVNLLNDVDYSQILQRKFATANIRFVSSVLRPISEGQGFLGDHFKLEITYELNGETDVEYFFIKTKPTTFQAMKDITNETDVFTLEIFLYDFLFPEFVKYGIDTSFAPKCYYCVRGETLVMEDLSRRGYTVPDAQKFFNLEECEMALKAIATYHASGLLYEVAKSKELGRKFCLRDEYPEMFEEKFFTYFSSKRNCHGEKWFTVSLEIFLDLIDLLPETEEYKKEFQERLRGFPVGKVFVEETNIQKFIGHGDMWLNNFLFKHAKGVVEHCCLVDFQTARYFYASFDVLNFLASNTYGEFYQKHSEELIRFYYKTLTEILAENSLDIRDYYSEEDYEKSLDIVELEAKLQGYAVHAYILIPDAFLANYISPEDNLQEYKFNNIVPVCRDYFKTDKQYRNIITSDLYELRATLFKF